MKLFAVIHKEGRRYVSWCPEIDVASQGKSIETALSNLKEAAELYIEDEEAGVIEGTPIITTIEVREGKGSPARRA